MRTFLAAVATAVVAGSAFIAPAPAVADGTPSWTWSAPVRIGPAHEDDGVGLTGVTGISCPSVETCVAVDDSGAVLSSEDADGGTAAWSSTYVGNWHLSGVACPS